MKKLLYVVLALSLCLLLSACGATAEETETAAQEETSQVVSSESGQNDEQGEQEVQDEQEAENIASGEEIVFSEMTVIDNDECSITITGIEPDNLWGFTLTVELENKSEDKTYMFSVTSAAVNGLQSDPYFASEVASGKKSINDISFSDSALEENGIDFSDIELSFRVYDSDDWTADAVATETVHVYPYGEDKAEVFERATQASDNVIIDNEYVTVTVIGYEEDSIWGYTVNLFLQNKTDTEVMFAVDDASVNGYMADPFWATSVLSGKCAFSSMYWYDSTLEEIGIDGAADIEEIEFLFRAYNYEDWLADDYASETITLNPNQ